MSYGEPYSNPDVTFTTSTITIPQPEPEVGYDDKKSPKENLARAMFEVARQMRLSRQYLAPLGGWPVNPHTPWWPPSTQPPVHPWCPDITCGTAICDAVKSP